MERKIKSLVLSINYQGEELFSNQLSTFSLSSTDFSSTTITKPTTAKGQGFFSKLSINLPWKEEIFYKKLLKNIASPATPFKFTFKVINFSRMFLTNKRITQLRIFSGKIPTESASSPTTSTSSTFNFQVLLLFM